MRLRVRSVTYVTCAKSCSIRFKQIKSTNSFPSAAPGLLKQVRDLDINVRRQRGLCVLERESEQSPRLHCFISEVEQMPSGEHKRF